MFVSYKRKKQNVYCWESTPGPGLRNITVEQSKYHLTSSFIRFCCFHLCLLLFLLVFCIFNWFKSKCWNLNSATRWIHQFVHGVVLNAQLKHIWLFSPPAQPLRVYEYTIKGYSTKKMKIRTHNLLSIMPSWGWINGFWSVNFIGPIHLHCSDSQSCYVNIKTLLCWANVTLLAK